MDRFEEMRTFAEVSAHGVTGAAKRLRIAPSAVSRRVRDLEARLGAELLTRAARRMTLTDAGRDYLTTAQQLLEQLEDAERRVGDTSGVLSGRIKLAAPLSFGLSHLMPLVNAFMDEHPDLELNLNLSDRRVDVLREGFDIAVRIGELTDSSLISRRLSGCEMVVAASPDFLAHYGVPKVPKDIAGWPGLCYAPQRRPEIWTARDATGGTFEVRVRPRLVSDNGDALCAAAVSGLGVLCEPEFIVAAALADGRLTRVLADYSWPKVDVFALWPARDYQPRRVRALIDHLVAHL
ncbi:MAG: LysR family transcriptional regulator [Devosia sp.]